MQFFFWLAFLVLVVVGVFAVQNSTAPPVDLKFIVWNLRTSLVYTILGSIVSGMVVIFLLWIPSAFRGSQRARSLRKKVELLEREKSERSNTVAPKAEGG